MVHPVVNIELACGGIQSFDTGLFFKRFGIEDNDFTISLFTVGTIPDRGPNLRSIVIKLDMHGHIAFLSRQSDSLYDLAGFLVDNLQRLLNLWLWMQCLVRPNVI